jgi:hypothetical protein
MFSVQSIHDDVAEYHSQVADDVASVDVSVVSWQLANKSE